MDNIITQIIFLIPLFIKKKNYVFIYYVSHYLIKRYITHNENISLSVSNPNYKFHRIRHDSFSSVPSPRPFDLFTPNPIQHFPDISRLPISPSPFSGAITIIMPVGDSRWRRREAGTRPRPAERGPGRPIADLGRINLF